MTMQDGFGVTGGILRARTGVTGENRDLPRYSFQWATLRVAAKYRRQVS